MILPVYIYGHPVLRRDTEDVSPDHEGLNELIESMWETMYHSEGVGLAAPQIGKSLRLIVIDGTPLADTFPECADSKMVLINPELEVIEDRDPEARDEGCLSLPGMNESVKRIEHVNLKWLDENFQPHEQEFSGFLSRIIQHEYDHLEGTMYVDRVSPIRKQLIKNKLSAFTKGKVNCDYRVVTAPRKH